MKKKDESHFWELQVQGSGVHEDQLRLNRSYSSSLCTFYFVINTDLDMDLCLEILSFIICVMS